MVTTIGTSNTQIVNVYQVPTNAVPEAPELQIATLSGQPLSGEQVSSNPDLATVCLSVRNTNDVDILNFCSRIQLPEPVVLTNQEIQKSTGIEIGWRPLRKVWNAVATGGAPQTPATVSRSSSNLQLSVTTSGSVAAVFGLAASDECFIPSEPRSQRTLMVGGPNLTGVWELSIAKMPPNGLVRVYFSTTRGHGAARYLDFVSDHVKSQPSEVQSEPYDQGKQVIRDLAFFWEGEFQFNAEGRIRKKRFFAPLRFDSAKRTITQIAVQPDKGLWEPVTLNFGF